VCDEIINEKYNNGISEKHCGNIFADSFTWGFWLKTRSQCMHFPSYTIPRDSEGYVVSFSLDEKEAFINFFDEFGFVVVKDVLTQVIPLFVNSSFKRLSAKSL
jgi:hypothetical protein